MLRQYRFDIPQYVRCKARIEITLMIAWLHRFTANFRELWLSRTVARADHELREEGEQGGERGVEP